MDNSGTSPAGQIKKMHVKETVLFAIQSIPAVDRVTLEKFLELVNTTGTFGAMTHEQVLRKMQQTLRYIPGASAHSLMILADLLEIPIPSHIDFSVGPGTSLPTYLPPVHSGPALPPPAVPH